MSFVNYCIIQCNSIPLISIFICSYLHSLTTKFIENNDYDVMGEDIDQLIKKFMDDILSCEMIIQH